MTAISGQQAQSILNVAAADAADSARPDADKTAAGDEIFFERLWSKLPGDVARSFNDAQLRAIVTAFGTRRWRDHAIDLRWLFPLFGRSYYFVLLVGAEQRSRARRMRDRLLRPLISVGNGLFAMVFFAGIFISLLVSLYLLKSFIGIDLLPDSSLGVYPIIKQELKMLFG